MESNILKTSEVRAALEALGHGQIQRLSALSGVSVTTLWSIRTGQRQNPGLQTVADFMQHIAAVSTATN